jgi:PAS domain S-box-containing protein
MGKRTVRTGRERLKAAEKRYHDLINWVDHAVLWEYDPAERKFVFVSKRSFDIFGYSPQKWIDDPQFFTQCIPPEERSVFLEMLEAGIQEGKEGRCEHRFFRADGKLVWVHSGINPRKDSHGKVNLLWGLTLDITNIKESESNQKFLTRASGVLASSFDYSKTIGQVSELIVPDLADWCAVDIVTEDGSLERLSVAHRSPSPDAWPEVLRRNVTPKQKGKAPILQAIELGAPVLWPEVTDDLLSAIAVDDEHLRMLRQAKMQSLMVIPIQARNRVLGSVSFVSSNPSHHFSEKDLKFYQELVWHVAIAIDNARLYAEAKKAIKIREEILGIVSHDLKTPLTSISIYAQTLMKKKGNVEILANRIHRTVSRMSRLISDFLDLAKIDAGHLAISKHINSVQKLIGEVADFVIPLAESKRLSIQQDVPQSPLFIECDHDRLLQVFQNIASNAIQFTPENGKITLGAALKGQRILFWISDTGPGISKDAIPHIFERYWQAKESKNIPHSAGLGLFIAKKMVEAHGGELWVESGLGQGSSFCFSLPSVEAAQGRQFEGAA